LEDSVTMDVTRTALLNEILDVITPQWDNDPEAFTLSELVKAAKARGDGSSPDTVRRRVMLMFKEGKLERTVVTRKYDTFIRRVVAYRIKKERSN